MCHISIIQGLINTTKYTTTTALSCVCQQEGVIKYSFSQSKLEHNALGLLVLLSKGEVLKMKRPLIHRYFQVTINETAVPEVILMY